MANTINSTEEVSGISPLISSSSTTINTSNQSGSNPVTTLANNIDGGRTSTVVTATPSPPLNNEQSLFASRYVVKKDEALIDTCLIKKSFS